MRQAGEVTYAGKLGDIEQCSAQVLAESVSGRNSMIFFHFL